MAMNAQNTHTPGPWTFDRKHQTIYSGAEECLNSLICKIATGENAQEEDANARLIAAAPELLKLLQKLADYHVVRTLSDLPRGELDEAIAEARAAIAKATGGKA